MRIVINGIGVAGPTLAYWLRRSGHEPLLVEKAPGLRSGGYAIDFWGVGYDVAEKMGLTARIRELGYQMQEVRFVGRDGHTLGGFPVDSLKRLMKGRYAQLRRSDLAAALYGALEGEVETIFNDSVTAIRDQGGSVLVEFARAAPREADLVVGADGLHSRVRELAFGPEQDFEVRLGYHVAAFEAAGYRPRDDLVAVNRSIPGRQITRLSLGEDTTLFLLVLRDEYLPARPLPGEQEQKAALSDAFAGAEWESPEILAAMHSAQDFYFDRVSQIRMEHWTRGRTALLGDAAACVSLLAGEGTGLAMAEAYVLAGELHRSPGDHAQAFARYEQRLKPFLKSKQAAAVRFASSFAPKTALGITFRNQVSRLLKIPLLANLLLGRSLSDDIELPDYGL
ncbi:monooxygenase FAD-binding protein [Desulfovibrio sp. X2]|uniref:FAD-binding domain n=1 Tax=Desulfovibrio sp. X2 TaxID=941449 RepID=UPI000358BF16|nr:FAD-binding domain [Desulfovibrio sp. X2]EPR44476.1 monooxygenase FAD-binding protein [Desulfovibrio sp. X2]